MIDPLFFVFVVISILSYGVQSPLNVLFSRQTNPLILTVYRNLSLSVTMLPVLFFATWEEVVAITGMIPTLLLASATGCFGFICLQTASTYLPVGIAQSIRQGVYVSVAVVLGMVLFGEYLSLPQLLILCGVLIASILIMLSRSPQAHLDESKYGAGALLAMTAGISVAFSFYFFSELSRALNPLVAGYFWEAAIGVMALAWLLVEKARGRYKDVIKLPVKQVLLIVLVSLTTISGTLGYSFAVNYGPYALASGLVTSTVLITAVAGWFLFKERLSAWQIFLVCTVVVLIFALRLLS